LTVGGVDDFNRRWSPLELDEIARLDLYHHNWSEVEAEGILLKKPEVLALARWLPSPVLPPTPVLPEMVAIGEVYERLLAGKDVPAGKLRAFVAHIPAPRKRQLFHQVSTSHAALWQTLRQRMNAHKWIHAYYQHVDGTSVAVAQVSAVAAQMIQANPALAPAQVKQLIIETALPLPHHPAERAGAGLIQPARAVAAAMRAPGGVLAGLPISGTSPESWFAAPTLGQGAAHRYVGVWAPQARSVSVVGDFNDWQPSASPLVTVRSGWWHGMLALPPGRHHYRFWVEGDDPTAARWVPDPENPARAESGYCSDHSVLVAESVT
jgi:serine protease AprX